MDAGYSQTSRSEGVVTPPVILRTPEVDFRTFSTPRHLGHSHYAATASASTNIFTVCALSGAPSEVGEIRSCHSVRRSSANASANDGVDFLVNHGVTAKPGLATDVEIPDPHRAVEPE